MLKEFAIRMLGGHTGQPEQRNLTDAVTQAIVDAAAGTEAGVSGAQEIAAGTVSRAFASAEAKGVHAGLFSPLVLSQIGRDLVTSGDSVWRTGLTRLVYVDSYDITPMDDGTYRYSVNTPKGRTVVNSPLHVRYSVEQLTGRGMGPLRHAKALGNFVKSLESRLGMESAGTVGYLLPVPAGGQDDDMAEFKRDLAQLKGKTAIVETTSAGYGEGRAASPHQDYQAKRIGPAIPQGNVDAFAKAMEAALAACGVPIELVQSSDGTGQREGYRRFLHGTVMPLARLVEFAALEAGLDVSLSFDALFASDIAGRARAFQSMVGAGMDAAKAAAQAGLIGAE